MCFLDCIPRGCSRSHTVVRVVLYRCFISTSAAPSPPPDLNHIVGLDCVPPCRYLPVDKPPPESKPPSNRRATSGPRTQAPSSSVRSSGVVPTSLHPISTMVPHQLFRRLENSPFMRPPAKLAIDVNQQGPRRGRKDDDRHHRDKTITDSIIRTDYRVADDPGPIAMEVVDKALLETQFTSAIHHRISSPPPLGTATYPYQSVPSHPFPQTTNTPILCL